MKIISQDEDGIVMYEGPFGLILKDNSEYYRKKGWSLDRSVGVFCPHCHGYLASFPKLEDAINAEIDGIYQCRFGHVFCSDCTPDWHESGEPYCAVCQDAAQERFFATLAERGIDAALAEFDPAASKQALYKACREKGIDVAYYNGNVYPIEGEGDSLIFDNVSLQHGYLPFISRLFFVSEEEMEELHMGQINTPLDFARVVEHRAYEDWTGGAGFGTFATTSGGRGWVYQTLSGRCLYFVPDSHSPAVGSLYCTGLDDSADFRQTITAVFGVPQRAYLPDIGKIVWVERPRMENGKIYTPKNDVFWQAAKKYWELANRDDWTVAQVASAQADTDSDVRAETVRAAGQIGEPALPLLERAAQDDDPVNATSSGTTTNKAGGMWVEVVKVKNWYYLRLMQWEPGKGKRYVKYLGRRT